MTNDEKAKAYEMALEAARKELGVDRKEWEVVQQVLHNIFPQLRESEDERIRKSLVRLVEQFMADERKEKTLAWLEKQKGLDKMIVVSPEVWEDAISDAFENGKKEGEKQQENPKSADSISADCVSSAKCGNSRHKVGDSLEGRKLADEVVAYLIKSGYQPIIKDTLDQKHFQIKIPRHKEDFFQSTEYKHCREILDEYYYEGDFAGDVYTLYVLKQKEQKPIIQDVELNDAVYDYVRDHFIAGADFTPEYIKKLMENAFFAGVDYYLLKRESESCEPDTNVEKVIEDVIRVYGKTQGEWVGGYDVDTLIVNLRRAFNKKEQMPTSTEDMPYITDEHFYEREPKDSFKYKLAEYMTKCCTKKEGPYGYTYGISAETILKMAKEELIKRGELKEHKPAEWSEEDADILNCCISSIEEAKENRYAYKETDGDTSYDREIDWLKSLRPSWKPSEEQMGALLWCIAHLGGADSRVLAELYEHLKKRM